MDDISSNVESDYNEKEFHSLMIKKLQDDIAYVELTDPDNLTLIESFKETLITYAKEKISEPIDEKYSKAFPTEMFVEYLKTECLSDHEFVNRVLLDEKSINKCMKWFYKVLWDYHKESDQCWMSDTQGKDECKNYFMTDEAEKYDLLQLESKVIKGRDCINNQEKSCLPESDEMLEKNKDSDREFGKVINATFKKSNKNEVLGQISLF